mmetsp:Transcript_55976/g.99666  ORF Transcript_55976/g.99666 Transcript_55976/m.99666 type:complete len:294 (+) Transcript_55976:1114-1995(+)
MALSASLTAFSEEASAASAATWVGWGAEPAARGVTNILSASVLGAETASAMSEASATAQSNVHAEGTSNGLDVWSRVRSAGASSQLFATPRTVSSRSEGSFVRRLRGTSVGTRGRPPHSLSMGLGWGWCGVVAEGAAGKVRCVQSTLLPLDTGRPVGVPVGLFSKDPSLGSGMGRPMKSSPTRSVEMPAAEVAAAAEGPDQLMRRVRLNGSPRMWVRTQAVRAVRSTLRAQGTPSPCNAHARLRVPSRCEKSRRTFWNPVRRTCGSRVAIHKWSDKSRAPRRRVQRRGSVRPS